MFNSIHQNLALFVPKHSQNSEICEISGPKITYLKKQTQFFRVSSPKTTIPPNSNPIQTQNKPNFIAAKRSEDGQTQFLALFNHGNTVLISVNQCLKLYLFMQNKPKFRRFSPKNSDFTKKRTQNKPKQSQISGLPK